MKSNRYLGVSVAEYEDTLVINWWVNNECQEHGRDYADRQVRLPLGKRIERLDDWILAALEDALVNHDSHQWTKRPKDGPVQEVCIHDVER